MATYDANWWFNWAFSKLPAGWFDPEGPIISAVVGGASSGLLQGYTDLQYVANQARIATASDYYLDLCSVDFLGFGNLPRRTGETDAQYRPRIQAEILRPRGTRAALISALTDLTGYAPVVFEPIRDASGWDNTYWDVSFQMGSYDAPFTFLVTVRRPSGPGIPFLLGWDSGYWDVNFPLGDENSLSSNIADAEIMNTITLTIPAGVKAFVNIVNGPIQSLPLIT